MMNLPQRSPRSHRIEGIRLGLCCKFAESPIAFRTTTAASLLRLSPCDRQAKISQICLHNAQSLHAALEYCAGHGIGCFRVASTILPVKTHSQAGYRVAELPQADAIVAEFRRGGRFAAKHGIRTTFHPDQFVVLNSPNADVVRRSVEDLESHAEIADWVGADVINIHAGGGYGDKVAALETFARSLDRLSDAVRKRLTVENDDTVFAPADLLPLCRATGLPLVYDVHHHRCLPDGMTVDQATAAAVATWDREPLFHISSPLAGWKGPRPSRHHDYIDPLDFPWECWHSLEATVEVEAKAKELAVARLRSDLLYRTCSSRVTVQ